MITNKIKILITQSSFLLLLLNLIFNVGCSKKTPVQYEAPVTAAIVVQKTVPLEIKSFGTAEAYSTVAIKSQVNGILTKAYFTEGQPVKKDDLLLTIDPRPFEASLKQAQANLAKDKVQLENAEKELVRQTDLLSKGYTSQGDFDQSKTTSESLRATVQADTAAVEYAGLQLEYCSIRSPIDGITGMLLIDVGNIIKSNDIPILTINQIKPIYVTFTAPQQYLADIQKYMASAELTVRAHKSTTDEQQEAVGRLSFVDNAVDSSTGTIKLRAAFLNEDSSLWPGQYTNVALSLTDEPNAIVIPSQGIQISQTNTFVYIIKADHTVEQRPITVRRNINNESVVDGVKAGEIIVTDGQLGLVPGMKVSIKNQLQK
jgi:multidrug efflux system membrane fusion protein